MNLSTIQSYPQLIHNPKLSTNNKQPTLRWVVWRGGERESVTRDQESVAPLATPTRRVVRGGGCLLRIERGTRLLCSSP